MKIETILICYVWQSKNLMVCIVDTWPFTAVHSALQHYVIVCYSVITISPCIPVRAAKQGLFYSQ